MLGGSASGTRRRLVTCAQLRDHLLEPEAAGREQNQNVIEEIRHLLDHLGVASPCRRERHLESLLAHLLCDTLATAGEKRGCVAAGGMYRAALCDDPFERGQEVDPTGSGPGHCAEAAGDAPVTDRPAGSRGHEQRITIAIGRYGLEVERVTRRLALLPELLPAAAEEDYPTPRERCLQSLAVHVTEHQDGAGVRVLHDRGQESSAFGEIEPVEIRSLGCPSHCLSPQVTRTATPAAFNRRLRSAMRIRPE